MTLLDWLGNVPITDLVLRAEPTSVIRHSTQTKESTMKATSDSIQPRTESEIEADILSGYGQPGEGTVGAYLADLESEIDPYTLDPSIVEEDFIVD
jgi:hypothetical protein